MTREEAEALLAEREKPCVRFFRRVDGTVMTQDCPVGAPRQRRRRVVVAVSAAAGLAAGAVFAHARRAGK